MGLREDILARNEASRRKRFKLRPGQLREHILSLGKRTGAKGNQTTNRARTEIPVASSLARDQNPEPGADSAGIASPLQELAAADRTFFPDVELKSTDGLFTLVIQPVQSIEMQDANGAEVVFNYDNPYVP